MNSNCSITSDTDIGYTKNALVRSPASKLLRRIPVSNISSESVIHVNMIDQHSPPPNPPTLPPPTDVDLINFSPNNTLLKTANNTGKMDQGIRPHVFSESGTQGQGTMGATSPHVWDHRQSTHSSREIGTLRNTLATDMDKDGNYSANNSTAKYDASVHPNCSSKAMPDARSTPGVFPIDTVITPMGTVITNKRIENDETSYHCPVANRFSLLQDKTYSSALNVNNSVNRASSLKESHDSIPVHISNRSDMRVSDKSDKRFASRQDHYDPRSHPEPELAQYDDEDFDDDFQMHIRRRSRRFYIGGFKPSISAPKLRHYVTRKGVPVTWISIRKYEKQNKAVIRLNVDADSSNKLLEYGFWPRGISCRPWLTKNQLRNKVKVSKPNNYGYSDHDTCEDDLYGRDEDTAH